jgi:hypothetical protein
MSWPAPSPKHAAFLLAAAVSSCSVVAGNDLQYVGSRNGCSSGCPVGARCVADLCAATKTSYPLLFEVTPPSSSYARGLTLFANEGIDNRSEGPRDLTLPRLSRFDVTMCDPATTCSPLAPSAHAIYVRLDRKGALGGAASGRFELATETGKQQLSLFVPPATYDMVIAPVDASRATIPPQLASVPLTGGTFATSIVPPAKNPTFTLTMRETDGTSTHPMPVGRVIDVIEPITNRPLSTVADTCASGADRSTVTLQLASPLPPGAILRVAPPSPACDSSPPLITYEFDLAALDLEGVGAATVTLPIDYKPVPVLGSVKKYVTERTQTPIAGILRLRAKTLDGVDEARAGNASFSTRVAFNTNTQGPAFVAFLHPGTYAADVFPDASPGTPSAGASTCIACELSTGKTDAPFSLTFRVKDTGIDPTLTTSPLQIWQVPRLVSVTSTVTAFDGNLLVPGAVRASATLNQPTLVDAPLAARSTSGQLVSGPQNLSLSVDPGAYDRGSSRPQWW